MWRQENTNRTKGNTDLTIRLRQQRKNIILNEDSSSKTMKPVWNPHSFCGTKKNKGEVKYWRTLLSSGPILNWGKQNIGFFFHKTSSAPMLSIWSFWKGGWLSSFGFLQSKALSGHFAETTLACPFQSPARRVLSPGTAPRYYIKPGSLLVVNLSKTYFHSTHPSRAESFFTMGFVLCMTGSSARYAIPWSKKDGNSIETADCACASLIVHPSLIDPWC